MKKFKPRILHMLYINESILSFEKPTHFFRPHFIHVRENQQKVTH